MASTRESYQVFPWWTARFWTWLTGKPAPGQTPLFEPTPTLYALSAVATYVTGLSLAVIAFRTEGPCFILALSCGWIMAVNGARRMISTVAHQCIHGRFTGIASRDLFIADLLAVMTLTQTAGDYREEHFNQHHRPAVFTTISDPAGAFLWRAGFKSGMSVGALWLKLFVTLLSPRFHASFFMHRLMSLVRNLPPKFKLIAAAGGALACWGAIELCPVTALVFGLLFPIVVLYQISVLLEFISEHAWFVPAQRWDQPKYIHATHSWGRFCGRRTPERDERHVALYVLSWIAWAVEHAIYHLPVRLFVIPGDLSQHDFHHRMPSTLRWTTATYAREEDLRSGDSRWPPYQEFWGLHNAIAHVFNGIAKAASHVDAGTSDAASEAGI
ncbi:hypothetical protein [Caballeronia sp. LZ001]|uniref:hypothetical protein n=1 Tax=Caballeronia sp. LZ001 TaxID=3038553 RepID=UPI0028603BB4|nr:hypothetical protein [Caballeronia sp. LZ001]MDR5806006.1 hypothetical protein [Caballeronia sp. LZ001]